MSRHLCCPAILLMFALPLAVFAIDMEYAARHGQVAAIKRMLTAGTNVNARYDIGRTALHIAARHGRQAAVQALIDGGADLNLQDNNGETPLHLAVEYEQIQSMKTLMSGGANPSLKDKGGQNPLQKAQSLNQGDRANRRLSTIVDYLERTKPLTPSAGGAEGIRAVPRGPGEPALHIPHMTLDLKTYGNPPPEVVRQAAKKALEHRRWRIMASETDREVGKLLKKLDEYRVEIRFLDNNQVRITFLRAFEGKTGWLENLQEDLGEELESRMSIPRASP